MISVYVSHATPHLPVQQVFLDELEKQMNKNGLKYAAIKACDIETNDTIRAIKDSMKTVYGLIGVAYGRRRIVEAVNKYGSKAESVISGLETTPYIQIETSIACAYEVPVLMVKEKEIIQEGVLEPYCVGITAPEVIDINDPSSYFSSVEWADAMEKFVAKVRANYIERNKFYRSAKCV